MKKAFLIAALFFCPAYAHAGVWSGITVSSCGTTPSTFTTGLPGPFVVDTAGHLCLSATSGTLLPLDVLTAAHTPAVAAHSLTRALSSTYNGHLYQLTRTSDSTTTFIDPVSVGGVANVAAHIAFCGVNNANGCTNPIACDQVQGTCTGSGDNSVFNATLASQPNVFFTSLPNGTTIPMGTGANGHFLRNRATTAGNLPVGTSSPFTVYKVAHTAVNATCCGDYGDVEATVADTGAGHMYTVAYSTGALSVTGTPPGPWPGIDRENGVDLYGPPVTSTLITILAKTDCAGATPSEILKSGDATTGALTTLKSGAAIWIGGCHLEGGLSLYEGGDGSSTPGDFLEGVMVASSTSDATDNLIQSNIISFYGASGAPPAATAWNFTTQLALPAGSTFARAACTGAIACVTDASYTDAPGASFSVYGTNVPIINSHGLGVFETRHQYFLNNEAPVTQTITPNVDTTKYHVFFCNGTGSITTAANTATGTGFGSVNCNSGTFGTFKLTVAGTVDVTVTGSVNWVDVQECFPSTCVPIPHLRTNAAVMLKAVDIFTLPAATQAILGQALSSYIVEFNLTTQSTPSTQTILGGPTGSMGATLTSPGNILSFKPIGGGTSVISNPSTLSLNTLSRVGFAYQPGAYLAYVNGTRLAGLTTTANQIQQTATPTTLGSVPSGNALDGYITQYAIYPYALSKAAFVSKTTVGATLP